MNGFSSHGLDEDAFGEKKGNIVQAFDAFRKHFFLSNQTNETNILTVFLFSISQSKTPVCDQDLRRREMDGSHDGHLSPPHLH